MKHRVSALILFVFFSGGRLTAVRMILRPVTTWGAAFFICGKPDPNTLHDLPKIGDKSLSLFATHGAAASSDYVKTAMNYAGGLVPEADIKGAFSCQGEVTPRVLEKIRTKPHLPVWLADVPAAVGHPDDADSGKLKRIVSALRVPPYDGQCRTLNPLW